MASSPGIGAKLLRKMGWSDGTGLGARRDGRVEPLGVPKRPEKLGIGAERRPFKEAWWETTFAAAYGGGAGKDLFVACEGRRCRPHGSAKLARLEEQDRMRGSGGEIAKAGQKAGDRGKVEVEGKAERRAARRAKKEKKLGVANDALRKERKLEKTRRRERKKMKTERKAAKAKRKEEAGQACDKTS